MLGLVGYAWNDEHVRQFLAGPSLSDGLQVHIDNRQGGVLSQEAQAEQTSALTARGGHLTCEQQVVGMPAGTIGKWIDAKTEYQMTVSGWCDEDVRKFLADPDMSGVPGVHVDNTQGGVVSLEAQAELAAALTTRGGKLTCEQQVLGITARTTGTYTNARLGRIDGYRQCSE